MKKEYDIQSRIELFPISFFRAKVENNDEIKNILVPKIVKDSEELLIPEGWFTHKLRTSFSGEKPGKEVFFGEDNTYQSILEQKYARCFDRFFDYNYQVMIDEIWYNCYLTDEYQEEHDHLGGPFNNVQFSCIHFLSFDKTTHNPPVFSDPLEQVRNLSLEMERNMYDSKYSPPVEEGDFIMFPSYLRHSVAPKLNSKDYPRITIAMNIKVLQYGEECQNDY